MLIQLMSIAGYEAYVCVCFFMYKTVCAAFIWLLWDARSCLYVCFTARKNYLIHKNLITKKYWNKNEKHLKNEQNAAAKKNRYILEE